MDLTVSIVNHNSNDLLHQCLQSILNSSIQFSYQMFVVDNKSVDGSFEMVESCFPSVSLIKNQYNPGFGRANNLVIRNTASKYILILNPDIILMPDTVNNMIHFMEKHSDVGILGCQLLNPDLTTQFSCRRYPNALTIFLRGFYGDYLFPKASIFRDYLMADWDHSMTAEVDWVMGSSMLLRRDALNEIGLFDERFFMYYEDVDICLRMWNLWRVCYFPHSQMIHYHIQGSHDFKAIKLKFVHIISACRFFRKHGLIPKRPKELTKNLKYTYQTQ